MGNNEKEQVSAPDTPFAAALTWQLDRLGWGGKARLANTVGRAQGYLSELKSGRKEGSEPTRRAIAIALGFSYESFLAFGEALLSGVSGEDALKQAREGIVAAGNYVLPGLQIRSKGHVVQNGVGNVVQHGGTEKTEHCAGDVAGGDIEQDLSRMIAAHLEGKTLDEKIEFRAEVKRLMEADREERAQASAS